MSFPFFKRSNKLQSCLDRMQLVTFIVMMLGVISSCTKDDNASKTFLLLKTGVAYTADGSEIPEGGTIKIGVLSSGGGSPLTYIRIDRIAENDTILQYDRGIYYENEGLDLDLIFSKSSAEEETWRITVMNADRVTAVQLLTIYKAEGTAYGLINYYPSITIGLQNNLTNDQYLDFDQGLAYNQNTVSGHEAEIDFLGYFYTTSGNPSPTFTCPGYSATVAYYPLLLNWTLKNSTLYDYYSVDNDLVALESFDAAINDSLLVSVYNSAKVSGNCKYCYTGKVVPFKTQAGKYGLIKVLHADESTGGSVEMAIKIQK
jgi:hypothetical protein